MTRHSEDWVRLFAPLVTELFKELMGAIFGCKETKKILYRNTFKTDYRGRA